MSELRGYKINSDNLNHASNNDNRDGACAKPHRRRSDAAFLMNMVNKRHFLLLAALVLATASNGVAAHNVGQGYIFVNLYDDAIDGRIEFTLADLNQALNLDFKEDHTASPADLDRHVDAIKAYALRRISFSINGKAAAIRLKHHELLTFDPAQYAALNFSLLELSEPPESIEIDYRAIFDAVPEHRGFLVVENNWKTGTMDNEAQVSLIFTPSEPRQALDLSSSSVLRGVMAMLKLGMHHIWIGIDHILFLLALLLPSVLHRQHGSWEPVFGFRPALWNVVAIVTLLTVAHTITLRLAALGTVNLPSRLVESIIAVSIAIAALEILLPLFRGYVYVVVFGFGLFHGFGFASVLGEIGIPSNYLVHSLLGFNLGVEVGQILIVCTIFPVLFIVRRWSVYTRFLIKGGAVVLILISMYWFIERAFEVDLPAGSIMFDALSLFGYERG